MFECAGNKISLSAGRKLESCITSRGNLETIVLNDQCPSDEFVCACMNMPNEDRVGYGNTGTHGGRLVSTHSWSSTVPVVFIPYFHNLTDEVLDPNVRLTESDRHDSLVAVLKSSLLLFCQASFTAQTLSKTTTDCRPLALRRSRIF